MKECLWYNGNGNYELLDFNPNGLSKEKVIEKSWEILKEKYFFGEEEKEKVIDTLYLINVDDLESLK